MKNKFGPRHTTCIGTSLYITALISHTNILIDIMKWLIPRQKFSPDVGAQSDRAHTFRVKNQELESKSSQTNGFQN